MSPIKIKLMMLAINTQCITKSLFTMLSTPQKYWDGTVIRPWHYLTHIVIFPLNFNNPTFFQNCITFQIYPNFELKKIDYYFRLSINIIRILTTELLKENVLTSKGNSQNTFICLTYTTFMRNKRREAKEERKKIT